MAHTVTQASGGPSLSGYSGSVWGVLVLLMVNLNQHQAGAEDLGQTQVKLSGLNHVEWHELGPLCRE